MAEEATTTEVNGPPEATCRHCGEVAAIDPTTNPDWLCPKCEKWQATDACPTCGQPVSVGAEEGP